MTLLLFYMLLISSCSELEINYIIENKSLKKLLFYNVTLMWEYTQ